MGVKRSSSMLKRLKESWRRLRAGTPGRRFQQQHSRRQESGRSPLKKALFVVVGLLLMAVGIFLLFVPGPGLVVLLLGALMVAQQSLLAARALDWAEVRALKLLDPSLRVWRRSSRALKILVVVFALVVAGAVGFGAFKLLLA